MQMTSRRVHERGVAMILALMALLLVAGIATLMFARTLNEIRHSADDTAIVQTLMLARGGANIGSGILAMEVNDDFSDIVERRSTPGRWAFGDDTVHFSDDGPVATTVVRDMAPAINDLQGVMDDLLCGQNVVPGAGTGEVSLRIHFAETACGESLPDSVSLPTARYVEGPPRLGPAGVQEYSIPFVMVSEAVLGEYRRNIVMQGEYRFDIGQASFAQYAYFTNRDSSTSGQIWFTENTMIDGPVHTNQNFAFYEDPWFGGRVTSAGCSSPATDGTTCRGTVRDGAFFYDRPSTLRRVSEMQPNSNAPQRGIHRPRFENSVTWDSQYIPLPQNAFDQKSVALGEHAEQLTQGIYFGDDLISLEMWAANSNGQSPTRNSNGQWNPAATHQFVQSCAWGEEWGVVRPGYWDRDWWWQDYEWVDAEYGMVDVEICELYRATAVGMLQKLDENSDPDDPSTWIWHTEAKPFNGVIYVEGEVERFRGPERVNSSNGETAPPTLASFSQITLVAEDDVRITRDLRYEQPPCSTIPVRNSNRSVTPATCDNLNHANVLGIYTPDGDIVVGNDHEGAGASTLNAPRNLHVHAVLMSASDQIRVEGHKERGRYRTGDRGQFYLMGGMIQENRGVFGTFGGSGRTGYDRVYTYDPRMRRGITPPYFPTTGLDEVQAVRYFSFGQREQVY